MMLMPAEEYKALKKSSGEEKPSKEASDVKLAKFQDAFIREQEVKKIKEDQNWERMASRLKPILSTQQSDLQELFKRFTSPEREQAGFVVSLLARLPKVTLTADRLLIDGQPVPDSLVTIVRDIMKNDVRGVESLLRVLRKGRRTVPPQLVMDEEESPSLSSTVIPTMKRKQEDALDASFPYTPSLLHEEELPFTSTPRRVTPIKASPKKASPPKAQTSPPKTQNPKVQRTPRNQGSTVQRSPVKTRSQKVQRSPVRVETANLPEEDDPSKKKFFWVSYR